MRACGPWLAGPPLPVWWSCDWRASSSSPTGRAAFAAGQRSCSQTRRWGPERRPRWPGSGSGARRFASRQSSSGDRAEAPAVMGLPPGWIRRHAGWGMGWLWLGAHACWRSPLGGHGVWARPPAPVSCSAVPRMRGRGLGTRRQPFGRSSRTRALRVRGGSTSKPPPPRSAPSEARRRSTGTAGALTRALAAFTRPGRRRRQPCGRAWRHRDSQEARP